MPAWVNVGSVALTTFAAICFIGVWFVARLASGYLETWLGGRRADVSIKEATAGKIWADIESAQPPAQPATTLPGQPTNQATAPDAKGVAFASIRFRVGRALTQQKSRPDVIRELWGYTSSSGGNYKRAGKLVDLAAQEFGFASRYPDWQLLASIENQTTVTVNSARGSVRISRD